MTKLVPLLAALGALMTSGCGGDDGSFTLATNFVIYTTPVEGVFTVTHGADALGCSRGTAVDRGPAPKALNSTLVFTCTKGDRKGSFVIRARPLVPRPTPLESVDTQALERVDTQYLDTVSFTAEQAWRFESGTGDFAGLGGKGDSIIAIDGNDFSGAATITGNVHYPASG